MTFRLARLVAGLALLMLAACAMPAPDQPDRRDVAELTAALVALGPGVDPAEAARMAEIAYAYPLQLRREYGVTDPPLIHNTKVNMGLRPRGLCYQWADDLEARLRQEGFRTIDYHRAIANAETLRIDHSVLIVSHPGGDMYEGIVLDGWRNSGNLYWSPTLEDDRYDWVPREIVFAQRRAAGQ